MSFSIAGKTAIVTGAANGVGLAIGRHFADAGANVVFADMDDAGLKDQMAEDAEKTENIRLFSGDLREKLTIANLLSATLDAFDRVDILINASRQVAHSDPLDPDDTTVEAMLQQNLLASLKLSQLVARRMIKQAEGEGNGAIGSIVNLSSIAARRTQPDLMAYSIAAAALDQMTRALAVALAHDRVRVNAVAFGSVMSAALKDRIAENNDVRDMVRDATPLARIASPREVAEAAQFLASDASAFMTGQIITVDGGRTLIDPLALPTH
ncbi:MAG: SDR family NAD(P)-dependent oxidoreductase [Shimia sp.]